MDQRVQLVLVTFDVGLRPGLPSTASRRFGDKDTGSLSCCLSLMDGNGRIQSLSPVPRKCVKVYLGHSWWH